MVRVVGTEYLTGTVMGVDPRTRSHLLVVGRDWHIRGIPDTQVELVPNGQSMIRRQTL